VHFHESLARGVRREVREEVGLTLQTKHLQPTTFFWRWFNPTQLMMAGFLCTKFTGTAAGVEGQKIKWVSLEELQRMITSDANILASSDVFAKWLLEHVGPDGNFAHSSALNMRGRD
jgi:8-oxo-dGTP pyrophosphatase MutT (NUDIX family)